MSTSDPFGGGGPISGGGGVIIDPLTGLPTTETGGGPIIPPSSSLLHVPVIVYNNKIISLLSQPKEFRVNPRPPATVNETLTGAIETVLQPRSRVEVFCSFPPWINKRLRVQLDNWWQWAVRGEAWRFMFDVDKDVRTTLAVGADAGDPSLTVVDPAGITEDSEYILVNGPNYQLVTVQATAGDVVVLTDTLDFDFSAGSLFRDQFLWDGCLLNAEAECPIHDLRTGPHQQGSFELIMEFYQAHV